MIISNTNTSGFFSSISGMQSLPFKAVPTISISSCSPKNPPLIELTHDYHQQNIQIFYSLKNPPFAFYAPITYSTKNINILFKIKKLLIYFDFLKYSLFFFVFHQLSTRFLIFLYTFSLYQIVIGYKTPVSIHCTQL